MRKGSALALLSVFNQMPLETSSRTAAAGKVPLRAERGEAVLWAQNSDLLPRPEACLVGIHAAFVRGTVPMAIFVNAWHTGCLSALYLAASLQDESVFPPPAAGRGESGSGAGACERTSSR